MEDGFFENSYSSKINTFLLIRITFWGQKECIGENNHGIPYQQGFIQSEKGGSRFSGSQCDPYQPEERSFCSAGQLHYQLTNAGWSHRTRLGTFVQVGEIPAQLMKLSSAKIEKAIYPAAFFRNKAQSLKELSKDLVENYDEKVPDKLEELLKLKWVGRKTANLTLTLGHDKPGICVDIHVHRISNRWGYVKTKTPDLTEMILREKLPRRYWKGYNDLLVTFGQNICKPVSPFCASCAVAGTCPKVGVTATRRGPTSNSWFGVNERVSAYNALLLTYIHTLKG
jgi:endonuclease-3